MIAHLWELRADVTPLERGAQQWTLVAQDLAATADDIVEAARHALDQGWESEAAESYEAQRRQIVQQIDTFTTVAARIGSSLTAIAGMVTAAQEELDRAWLTVAAVPHDLVGAERTLVLHPATPADEELVQTATATARAIRGRLQDQLYDESARLRETRMELATVRSDLVQAARGAWPAGALSGAGALDGVPGSGTGATDRVWGDGPLGAAGAGAATSVAGTAAGGGAGVGAAPALPGLAPIAVSMPDLTGLSAGALTAGATGLLGGAAGRRGRRHEPTTSQTTGMAPMGGMAAGAAMRGGGGALGRPGGGGASRAGKPVLSNEESPEQRAARIAREKEQARDAKRQLIAERKAERAARRAHRAESEESRPSSGVEVVEVAPGEDPRPRRG